jgi:nucleotide-binding universal stress UspA family protein
MQSILIGVDRSEGCLRAVKFASERARANQWRMTIAHVINWSRYSFPTQEENEARPVRRQEEIDTAQTGVIDPVLKWLDSEGYLADIDVTTVIRHGRPSEVLADLAGREGQDLIVVGRVGDANLRTAIFGSTASRLVQHAPVPVVVVP